MTGRWPALYFADARGRIRHHHFGEGEYRQSEMVIQQLLAEAKATDHDHEPVSACRTPTLPRPGSGSTGTTAAGASVRFPGAQAYAFTFG